MDELNALNAPKKVVDGLVEVFDGLAQMFAGVSEQLDMLACLTSLNFWAQMLSRRESVSFRSWIRKLLLCLRRKVQQHRIPVGSRSRRPER